MHVYVDPASPNFHRPGLLERLATQPATAAVVPEENQLTEVLAWLVDTSPKFARDIAGLFAQGDPEAEAAVATARVFGARTRVSLVLPTETVAWPDLSISGDARSFEFLVEVKVSADFHTHAFGGNVLKQPDAYAVAWDRTQPASQASVRRVVTLMRAAARDAVPHPLRGRNVEWREVSELLAESRYEPDVARIVADFKDAIDVQALRKSSLASPSELASLFKAAGPLLEKIASRVAEKVELSARGHPHIAAQHCGLYPKRNAGEALVDMWLAVHPRGGQYNLYGNANALSAQVVKAPQGTSDSDYLDAGLTRMQTIGGWRYPALFFPLAFEGTTLTAPDGIVEALVRALTRLGSAQLGSVG